MKRTNVFSLIQKCCDKIEIGGDNDGLYFSFGHEMRRETILDFANFIIETYATKTRNERVSFGNVSCSFLLSAHGFSQGREIVGTIVRFRVSDPRLPSPRVPENEKEREECLRGAKLVLFRLEKDMKRDGFSLRPEIVDHAPHRLVGTNAGQQRNRPKPTP